MSERDSSNAIAIGIWKVANTAGILILIWALVSYREFDPRRTFFSQPHYWLLGLMWLTNPRALAAYYIFCAKPPVGHWLGIALVGGLLVPGAWGLYFLPGLSAGNGLRLVLGGAGFFFRDVVEKDLIEKPLVKKIGFG